MPRASGRQAVGGIVYVIRNGLKWKDAPKHYELHKTLYNRFVHWSRPGVSGCLFAALAREGPKPEHVMIDSIPLKAHRTSASLLKKRLLPAVSDGPKGGLNSKLHAAVSFCLLSNES